MSLITDIGNSIRFPERLPPLNSLYKDIVQRESGTALKPDPEGRNLLFQAFYQYFMLQFFNNDFNMTVRTIY